MIKLSDILENVINIANASMRIAFASVLADFLREDLREKKEEEEIEKEYMRAYHQLISEEQSP